MKCFDDFMRALGTAADETARSFTLDPSRLGGYGGFDRLTLSDVPLLLLAGAVEGGAENFCLSIAETVRFEWGVEAGPSKSLAAAVLRREGVPFSLGQGHLSLPLFAQDFLTEFFRRGRYAPLTMHLPDGTRWSARKPDSIEVTSSQSPRLLLVDRGVSFACPFALEGLDVVAVLSEPLNGDPWPRNLVMNSRLETLLGELAQKITIF